MARRTIEPALQPLCGTAALPARFPSIPAPSLSYSWGQGGGLDPTAIASRDLSTCTRPISALQMPQPQQPPTQEDMGHSEITYLAFNIRRFQGRRSGGRPLRIHRPCPREALEPSVL